MNIDAIFERSVLLSIPIYRKQTVKWIREARQLESYKSFVSLSPVDKSFQKLSEKSMILSYLTGIVEAQGEIDLDNKSEIIRDFKTTGIDDALRILKSKNIVSPEQFRALSAELKTITFSVQKIERIGAIIEIQKSLLRKMETGAVFQEWVKEIPEIFVKYGITPLSPHHLEVVFRNNTQGAYNIARFEKAVRDPIVHYLKYYGIADGRSEDICEPYFNKVYRKDDPIWERISPQNHHFCRCTTGPITKFKAERENIQPSDHLPRETLDKIPDDFKKSPRTLKSYKKKMDKLLKDREKYNKELSKEREQK